jgi:hypothetical protein
VAQPRSSGTKNGSIFTMSVTAALLSLPMAVPIVAAEAGSPIQPSPSESLHVHAVTPPVAEVDTTTERLIDPKTGTVIDRAKGVLDPATGKLVDPVTGVILPSDAPTRSPAMQPSVSRTAVVPQKPASATGAASAGSLAAPYAAPAEGGLLASPDEMVVNVVDEVLGASSRVGLKPLTALLEDRKASDGGTHQDTASSFSSGESASARSAGMTGPVRAPSRGARTVGSASGVSHLPAVPERSDLSGSQGFRQQAFKGSQVSVPSVAADDLAAAKHQLAAGQVNAASVPAVFHGTSSWLISTASSLFLAIGGFTAAYGIRRRRSHSGSPCSRSSS